MLNKSSLMNSKQKAVVFAILAALLYALSSPLSKILLQNLHPTMMAALLYLGAGIGISMVGLVQNSINGKTKELHLTKKELPYTLGMIILDILAPIFLMIGLQLTTAANASLLNNFEIVATSIVAFVIFRERVSKKVWIAIVLVTLSSALLSIQDLSSFSFSIGSLFVLLACLCWGVENNFTRILSSKNPMQIVIMKGFGSGLGSLLIAYIAGDFSIDMQYIIPALVLGFFAYGLSILFYVYAQRELGTSKTSAYYAFAPFIGTGLSLIIFREIPSLSFMVALVIMLSGAYLAYSDQ